MPETPDVNTIALRALVDLDPLPLALADQSDTAHNASSHADRRRAAPLIWAARGAADLAELDAVLAGASPSMKAIDQIIRALSR